MKTRSPSSTSSSESGADPLGLVALPDEQAAAARPALRWVVLLLFLGALAGTGFTDSLFPAPRPRLPVHEQLRFAAQRERASLADGSAARLVEYELRLTSRVRRLLAKPYSTFLFVCLGETSERVLRGRGDWLFMRERAVPPPLPDEDIAGLGAAVVAALERRVHDLGLPVVVAPIPRKAVLHADRLPRGVDPRAGLDRRILDALRERGVNAVDLLRLFEEHAAEGIYYPCDSHWTPAAGLLAAEEIVRVAGRLVPEEERRTVIRRGDDRTPLSRLDLLGYMDVELGERRLEQVRRQGRWNYAVAMPEGPAAAFPPELEAGREAGRIALSGTSFSAGNLFPRSLSHFAQQPVLDASLSAARFAGPLRQLFRRRASFPDLDLVVFEFAIHQLFFAPDEDGIIAFPDTVGLFFAENPPPRTFALTARPDLQWSGAFSGGDLVKVGGRSPRLVATLPAGALLHAGDGSMALVVRGQAQGSRPGIELRIGAIRLRAPWPEGAREVVIPLIFPRAEAQAVRALAFGGEGARMRIEGLELVAQSIGGRVRPLHFGDAVRSEDRWTLRTQLSEPLPTDRYALLLSAVESGQAGAITEIVARSADPSREPLRVEVRRADRGAALALHLGRLAGEALASVELGGTGEPPGADGTGYTLWLVD